MLCLSWLDSQYNVNSMAGVRVEGSAIQFLKRFKWATPIRNTISSEGSVQTQSKAFNNKQTFWRRASYLLFIPARNSSKLCQTSQGSRQTPLRKDDRSHSGEKCNLRFQCQRSQVCDWSIDHVIASGSIVVCVSSHMEGHIGQYPSYAMPC